MLRLPGVRSRAALGLIALLTLGGDETASAQAPAETRWCDLLPRAANAALRRVKVSSEWFEVYQASEGVFALVEPRQFQEAISYLIVGRERACCSTAGSASCPFGRWWKSSRSSPSWC